MKYKPLRGLKSRATVRRVPAPLETRVSTLGYMYRRRFNISYNMTTDSNGVATNTPEMTDVAETAASRVYEAGYHIVPMAEESKVETVVSEIRSMIEKNGGSLVAEGAPVTTKLAFELMMLVAGKKTYFDTAHFGWLKFEASAEGAAAVSKALELNPSIIRSMVFRTVKEDTRAKFKAPTLREVKRTDTLKSSARKEVASTVPVTEADIDKAISDITTE